MSRISHDEEQDLERDIPGPDEGDEGLEGEPAGLGADDGMDEDDAAASSLRAADQRRRSTRVRLFVAAVIAIVLLAIGGLGAWWYVGSGSRRQLPQSKSANRSSLGGSDTSASGADASGAEAQAKYLKSIGVPDYYAVLKDKQSKDQAAEADAAAVAGMPDNTQTSLMSSTSNPEITDDVTKAFNPDGTMNPNYSFLTAENVSRQVRDDMEILVNPIYGSWTALQSPQAGSVKNPGAVFAPMFVKDKVDAVQDADLAALHGLAPVFADWGSDSYGGRYANRDFGPIVGTPGPVSCDYRISGTDDDSISCSADVTYHVRMSDSDEKTETHTLRIGYRPDYSGQASNDSRRILIDSIQQQ